MSLIEAGACGLPAVATDVPGTREILVHGDTGLLAPPGDAVALGSAMNRMMNLDANARFYMGAKARRRVVDRFSLNSVLDRWESLYAELAAARRG